MKPPTHQSGGGSIFDVIHKFYDQLTGYLNAKINTFEKMQENSLY